MDTPINIPHPGRVPFGKTVDGRDVFISPIWQQAVIEAIIKRLGGNSTYVISDIANLTLADGAFLVGDGTTVVAESGATARTSLGLGSLATQSSVTESDISLSDVTTDNVSTTKHGFAPKLPNDATTYLDGTGAYSVPAGGGGTTYKNTSTQTVNNTASETDVFPAQSITGGAIGSSGLIRVTLTANLNHGVAGTCTIRFYYGATVIGSVACDAGGKAASKPVTVNALIANLGAENSQRYNCYVIGQDGSGAGASTEAYARWGQGTAAADTSSTANFKITAQWGSASPSLTYTQYNALVEIL